MDGAFVGKTRHGCRRDREGGKGSRAAALPWHVSFSGADLLLAMKDWVLTRKRNLASALLSSTFADFLGRQLEQYVATLSKPVHVERMGERTGLIRARLKGRRRSLNITNLKVPSTGSTGKEALVTW